MDIKATVKEGKVEMKAGVKTRIFHCFDLSGCSLNLAFWRAKASDVPIFK